jgi:hypothetical protein
MEHEFVPGKRRCRNCDVKYVFREDFPCCEADAYGNPVPPPKPEPEKPPQVWHLNVWTDIGVARFAVSKAITQKEADALPWRFRLMEEGKGPAAEPLDGVETALVNSLIQLISEIRSNKPPEETK